VPHPPPQGTGPSSEHPSGTSERIAGHVQQLSLQNFNRFFNSIPQIFLNLRIGKFFWVTGVTASFISIKQEALDI